jgi:hypothetical protein
LTGGLGDVRAALAEVEDGIGAAVAHAGVARQRIADAIDLLADLDAQHSSSLVPPELRRAADTLDTGLHLMTGGVAAVADIGARL